MKAVIYRIYATPEGKKKFLQGKVFRPNKYDFDIYYRDVYPKKSTLWKTRYEKPESESFNIDHLVFDYLVKENITQIHYYIVPKRKLLRIEVNHVERHIRLGNVKQEMLNNHTQYFIPQDLFKHSKRDYSTPWIDKEISINDLLKQQEEEFVNQPLIPNEVKIKLAQTLKNSSTQLTLI